jgi:hypothetical protein
MREPSLVLDWARPHYHIGLTEEKEHGAQELSVSRWTLEFRPHAKYFRELRATYGPQDLHHLDPIPPSHVLHLLAEACIRSFGFLPDLLVFFGEV